MPKFELTDCNKAVIKEICESFGNKEGEIINILHNAQGRFGYLPEEVQEEIAKNVNMPLAKIYGIVSFYSFFTMKAKGENPINVCLGTACYVRGGEKVLEAVKSNLKIEVGDVTEDGKFSLNTVRCVGACGIAPVMMIGDKVYGHLDAKKVNEILESYK